MFYSYVIVKFTLVPTAFCYYLQLRLQSQLQKREALVSKKGELTAKIESQDREIKVEIQ